MRLSTAGRRLRYLARPEAKRDADVIDSLRTELSSVHFEIELIALPEVVNRSNKVRRETLSYINRAFDETSAGGVMVD